ncbi:amidase [Leucobacter sp. GX24907]
MPIGALELRDALRSGETTAVEAVQGALRRARDQQDLGAFTHLAEDRALAEAERADDALRRAREAKATGTAELPGTGTALLGLPIAHKDLVDVAGHPTTHGSAAVPHALAERDDPGAAQLRSAGALSIGKTQVPEFGLTGYSENLIAAPARNPLDPSRTAGGSSGGSAAAVASGILPVAPGSDGGGSIRIPAFACGLIGLKPRFGAVPSDSARGRTDAFGAPRLTVTGPIARSAEDAALLYDAQRGLNQHGIDQHDTEPPGTAHHSTASALEAVASADRLRKLRIGFCDASPFDGTYAISLHPESRRAFERAAELLEQHGHRVDEAQIRYDPRYPETFTTVWTAGLSLLELESGAEDRLAPLTREFRERALARGETVHREAAKRIHGIAADMRRQWGRYDVVLTPGLAFPAPRVGAFLALSPDDDYRLQCEWAPYTSMVNVAGLPAIAVPILRIPEVAARVPADTRVSSGTRGPAEPRSEAGTGLSMGVQLIGRTGSEPLLLQLAAQLMS